MEASRVRSLILVPGLGADRRLFDAQRGLPGVRIIDWVMPEGDEPLASYARRLAALIDAREPVVLAGVSFGGIVALEMARYLDARGVILIASLRNASAIPWWYRWAGRAAEILPARWCKWIASRRMLMSFAFAPMNAEAKRLLAEMVDDTPAELLAWGIRRVIGWHGSARPDVPVYQIHGSADRILAPRRASPDRIVQGAGHLVNVTHAAEVNQFILSCLARE